MHFIALSQVQLVCVSSAYKKMLPMNTSTNHHRYHRRRGRASAAACFRRKKRSNRRKTGRGRHQNTNNKWANAATPKNNVVQLFEFPWPGGVSFTEHICEQDMIAYEESLYNTVKAVLNDNTLIYTHSQPTL